MSTTSTPSFALCKKAGSKSILLGGSKCCRSYNGVAVYYQRVPDRHIGLARVLWSHWHVWFVASCLNGLYKGYTMNGLFNFYIYFRHGIAALELKDFQMFNINCPDLILTMPPS